MKFPFVNTESVAAQRKSAVPAGLALSAVLFLLVGCATVGEATRAAVGDAVGQAVSQRVDSFIAGYTDVMLYQLVYAQAFHLGGFGVAADDFAVGQGSTWRVRTYDQEHSDYFTAERALLERTGDGSTWWYLNYTRQNEPPIEFEVLVDRNLQAREMYLRDPESGQIRRHEFAVAPAEQAEYEEGEAELEQAGHRTAYTHLEEWGAYRQDRERVQVGAGTFDADILSYTDPEMEEQLEFRWWVTESAPGHLVKFELNHFEEGRFVDGEMTDLRQDYQRSLSL